MKLPAFTVTQKVAAGYLLLVCFSLVALVFALSSLRAQTERSERLVSVEFKGLNLARNLRQNLLARENLTRQAIILQDDALIELLERRDREYRQLWNELSDLGLPQIQRLTSLENRYGRASESCGNLLSQHLWPEAEECLEQTLAPLHDRLADALERFAGSQQEVLDESLNIFSEASAGAYRITLTLVFLGVGLSAPVAMAIIIGVHRSIRELTRAAQEIASGSFERPIAVDRRDEFGLLAREFSEMGRKLRELEQLRLDANPLTYLPGSLALDREMEARITSGHPFAHLYIDLDNFKAYNDRYGYRAGSAVLAWMAELIREIVNEHGCPDDLVAHIGGDDFIVIAGSLERAEKIARELISRFETAIPEFYSEEDRLAGAFDGEDRFGEKRRFPLMTVSIAIVWSGNLENPTVQTISRECVKMKEHLKALPGSNHMLDRRRNP